MDMRKLAAIFALALMLVTSGAALAASFPDVISLPNGFQPEGIVSGAGTDFYVGSLANGAIYKGDLRTGEGAVWVQGAPGRVAVGLAYDERSGYLFVAGGPTGTGSVYDTRTGALVASYQFIAPDSGFVNDVIVTGQAAYFTDSRNAQLYVVPLGSGGAVSQASGFEVLALGGDWDQIPDAFNANGIEATPNGKALIVINSTLGAIFRVDPNTGVADLIELVNTTGSGDTSLSAGDGLLLDGKTLYVVRNRLNLIAVVQLANDLGSGEIVGGITDGDFRVPTTLTEHGNRLYAVNARFGTPPGPDVEYEVVQVRK
jgi:sugar lactone lactonase YvrE